MKSSVNVLSAKQSFNGKIISNPLKFLEMVLRTYIKWRNTQKNILRFCHLCHFNYDITSYVIVKAESVCGI